MMCREDGNQGSYKTLMSWIYMGLPPLGRLAQLVEYIWDGTVLLYEASLKALPQEVQEHF